MRDLSAIAVLVFLAALPAAAVDNGACQGFEAPFRQGSGIEMELRSGDIEIRGAETETIRVECESKAGDAREIRIEFEEKGSTGRLKVSGGPSNDVRIRIQVPKESNLVVRCSAGDLDVIGVRGDKDVSLRAGDLTIEVGQPAEYAKAEASVKAGDIQASAFGVHKGGLFRSFKHRNPAGRYELRASLWAGDIKLR